MKLNTTKSCQQIFFGLLTLLFTWSVNAAEQSIEEPVIGEKGYYVGSYGGGAYWVTDGLYNSMFVVSEEGIIVIDAPGPYADKLPDAIREVTDKPVKYFIYSHHHQDHTGGSGVFGDDVIRVGHELTAQELRRKNDPNRPVPTITFSDTYTVELGNQRIELSYPGLQHSPGNSFVYLPKQKVLMLVDVLYPGWVPFKDFAVAASVPGYFHVFDQAKEYDFDYFQGGHVKWSTKSGHRVKAVNCQDEVNDDNRKKKAKQLHGRFQARSSGAGHGAGLQDFRSGSESGCWSQFDWSLVPAV